MLTSPLQTGTSILTLDVRAEPPVHNRWPNRAVTTALAHGKCHPQDISQARIVTTVSNELCYTTTADLYVEYVPNVRRAPTHRVDLTRPERRSIAVRAPRRRTTAHLPFVDSDPFSHNYTSSPYVGAQLRRGEGI